LEIERARKTDLAQKRQAAIVGGEGIESKPTPGYLKDRGCDQAQGDLFSQPLPAHELEFRYRHHPQTVKITTGGHLQVRRAVSNEFKIRFYIVLASFPGIALRPSLHQAVRAFFIVPASSEFLQDPSSRMAL
jgi:hypothetical protein